jgi:hypothetical protein
MLRQRLDAIALRGYALLATFAVWTYRHWQQILIFVLCLALILMQSCQSRATRLSVPEEYLIYLPYAPMTQFSGHGVVGSPVKELGADWYYHYGYCDPPCVPMDSAETVGFKGWCAPVIMLGNESELPQWTGRPTIPIENLVAQSFILRTYCPDAYIIALNFSHLPQGLEYAREFISRGGEYDSLGFHVYTDSWIDAANYIDYIKSVFPNTPLCLTEVNTVSSDVENFRMLLNAIHTRLTCSAVFMACWSCEGQSDIFDLQRTDGTLTPKGEIFAKMQ